MAKPKRICSIPDCGKWCCGHGYCTAHYLRFRRHGDPLGGSFFRERHGPLCKLDGCGKPSFSLGWCSSHYGRNRTHGDPLAGKASDGEPLRYFLEVVLPYEGKNCLTWPYGRDSNGYGGLWVDGVSHRAHRLACERVHGPAPRPDLEAAHSCGKGHEGCCNPNHLSWKTRAENENDKYVHGTRSRKATTA